MRSLSTKPTALAYHIYQAYYVYDAYQAYYMLTLSTIVTRGGVEDTRLEAKPKAKDTKKIRGQGQGQGQPFLGQTLSRPRTGMLEAKAKE